MVDKSFLEDNERYPLSLTSSLVLPLFRIKTVNRILIMQF